MVYDQRRRSQTIPSSANSPGDVHVMCLTVLKDYEGVGENVALVLTRDSSGWNKESRTCEQSLALL